MAYTKSAETYDKIFASRGKDYAGESAKVHSLIQQHKRTLENTLLDVGCGTGGHLVYLRHQYAVEGLDLSEGMLAAARERCPELTFHQGNMIDFALSRQFGAVVRLFSAIGYVQTGDKLGSAMRNMTRHLLPGGVLVIEPWVYPAQYRPDTVHAVYVDEPAFKLARMTVSRLRERVSVMEYHFLVATPDGVERFEEIHEMGLFTHDEYLAAFQAVGLETVYDPEGLIGRGLYIGVKSDR